MTAQIPRPTLRKSAGVAFAVLVTIIAAVGAQLTYLIWALGVGVHHTLHNAIGAIFVAVNVGCWIVLFFLLRQGRKTLALIVSLAPAPLSMLVVYIAAKI